MITKMKLSTLILDFNLYPRAEVDTTHVRYMCDAQRAGIEFPPIIVDQKSKRIIDGFHRSRMYARMLGADAEVDVILKKYENDGEMFAEAMRLNATHGRTLTRFDRVHCAIKAESFGLTAEQTASALCLTTEAVGKLKADRIGRLSVVGGTKEPLPLKRTIRHMAGRDISMRQAEANDKLSGMAQLFYVNQLILLIENELLDAENEALMAGLGRLGELISKRLDAAAPAA